MERPTRCLSLSEDRRDVMRGNAVHVDVLLESTEPTGEMEPGVADLITGTERELLIISRAVLGLLRPVDIEVLKAATVNLDFSELHNAQEFSPQERRGRHQGAVPPDVQKRPASSARRRQQP
jgi:hypothetical protein